MEVKEGGLKDFFVAMIPPTETYQEHKVAIVNGKPGFYEPPKLKAARQKLKANLGKHVPDKPHTGAVRLMVKWLFPKGTHKNGAYKKTKPDIDNLQKMLKDIMTELGFWKDDALVASEIVEKFWAEKPGLYIALESLEPCYYLQDEVCVNADCEMVADFPDEDYCRWCKFYEYKN